MRALVPLVHESGINPESYLNPLEACNMQEDGGSSGFKVGSAKFGQLAVGSIWFLWVH